MRDACANAPGGITDLFTFNGVEAAIHAASKHPDSAPLQEAFCALCAEAFKPHGGAAAAGAPVVSVEQVKLRPKTGASAVGLVSAAMLRHGLHGPTQMVRRRQRPSPAGGPPHALAKHPIL